MPQFVGVLAKCCSVAILVLISASLLSLASALLVHVICVDYEAPGQLVEVTEHGSLAVRVVAKSVGTQIVARGPMGDGAYSMLDESRAAVGELPSWCEHPTGMVGKRREDLFTVAEIQGWPIPFAVFRSRIFEGAPYTVSRELNIPLDIGGSYNVPIRYSPILSGIVWWRFTGNTACYVVIILVSVALFLVIRRFVRLSRLQCTSCGQYVRGVATGRCAECGARL